MKVTYIQHSGFLVEWERCVWLFDYYQGKIPDISREKKLFVFVSHSHGDHFNPEIFEMFADDPQVEYILASEVRRKVRELGLSQEKICRVHFLKPHESWSTDDGAGDGVLLHTYRSTDRGVAFLAEYQGKKVYHGGDLNWWVWKGETKQQYNDMTVKFQREVQLLREEAGVLDAAFLPLDPRQEEWYRLGMDYFLEQIEVKTVFPMHFWGDYSVIDKYKKESKEYGKRVVSISREGDEWEL